MLGCIAWRQRSLTDMCIEETSVWPAYQVIALEHFALRCKGKGVESIASQSVKTQHSLIRKQSSLGPIPTAFPTGVVNSVCPGSMSIKPTTTFGSFSIVLARNRLNIDFPAFRCPQTRYVSVAIEDTRTSAHSRGHKTDLGTPASPGDHSRYVSSGS